MFKMLKTWKKRRDCDHDFYKVKEVTYWGTLTTQRITEVEIYCPKCGKTGKGSLADWTVFQRKEQLRKMYKKA